MLEVAMLSKWHVHASGYANDAIATGKVKITAVWDDDSERGSAWAKELGCDFESDLDKLLARNDVKAVICDAPTTEHKEIIIKAARANKHIFTEKALAPTVKECEEIASEIEKAGITFTISLPQRIDPVIQFAKKMIDENAFGKISVVRIRNGHDGVSGNWLPEYWFDETKTGGGALMDLGCHPMYTATYLLGAPVRMTSIMTSPCGTKLDESASATIEFADGAICTGETSFVTYRTPGAVEIYGTKGTLLAYGNYVKFYQEDIGKYSDEGVTPTLPEKLPSPLVTFINACVDGTGTPPIFSAREAVGLTRLLENAYISNKENKTVTF